MVGKGKRPRAVPFGVKTGQAIEKYQRLRSRHALAKLPALWLGSKGPLTDSGVAQMLRRRCRTPAWSSSTPTNSATRQHTTGWRWAATRGTYEAVRLAVPPDAQPVRGERRRRRARDAYRRLSPGDQALRHGMRFGCRTLALV